MHLFSVCSVLLACLAFQFVLTSEVDSVLFKVRINKKGTRFNESVRISEKENTVTFKVPKHNDVDRSEVLNDFNQNVTITRVPDVGICYIKPLERNVPNPRELKLDMNYMKNAKTRMKELDMLVRSSQWILDKKLKREDVAPSVARFCAGLPIYRLKKTSDDDMVVVPGNDTSSSRKKRTTRGFLFCSETDGRPPKNPNCDKSKWFLECNFVLSKTCIFWTKCSVLFQIFVNQGRKSCKFTHSWTSVYCCKIKCKAN